MKEKTNTWKQLAVNNTIVLHIGEK